MRTASRALAELLLVSAGCTAIFGQALLDRAPSLVRLKSGLHYADSNANSRALRSARALPSAHFVAIFSAAPTDADAWNLRRLGYRVLSFVPDNGLLVYGNVGADLSAWGVVENYTLRQTDKLSSRLNANSPAPLFAIVDIQPDAVAGLVWMRLLAAGVTVLPNPDLRATEHLVQAPFAALQAVANWDDVAYIYPASPQMIAGQAVVPCAIGNSEGTGVAVAANLVPTIGDGWAGPSHGAATLSYDLRTAALPLAESDVRSALHAVIGEWSAYAAITFTPTAWAGARTSIDISFPSGDHGDGFPFAPYGTVLAHTFYPPPNPEPIAGDMHLNYDEAWSLDGSLQLYAVMLHEMGHALGLGHSDDPDDVMYPYYQTRQHLAAGDITALRTLYAAPSQFVAPPVTPPDPAPLLPTIPWSADTPVVPVVPSAPVSPGTPAVTPPKGPGGGDIIPPQIKIYSPATAAPLTYQATMTVQGFASDNVGVTQIVWSNSVGGSGSVGVANPFIIPGIVLAQGVNRIRIQAYDAAGNAGSAYLTVTKK